MRRTHTPTINLAHKLYHAASITFDGSTPHAITHALACVSCEFGLVVHIPSVHIPSVLTRRTADLRCSLGGEPLLCAAQLIVGRVDAYGVLMHMVCR